jgi:dipeptidyl aminopeptidase/acylaminoacyl peptidase
MMPYTEALNRCRRYTLPYTEPPQTFDYPAALHWAWASPDGRYVAVGVESAILPTEMHLLDAHGRFLWAFPLEATLYGWLSDSATMIVIAQNPPQREFHYLWARDGSGVRFAPIPRRDGTPSQDDLLTLSPDHTRLIFGSDRDSAASGRLDLYLLNFTDGVITRLTTDPVPLSSAVWCAGG